MVNSKENLYSQCEVRPLYHLASGPTASSAFRITRSGYWDIVIYSIPWKILNFLDVTQATIIRLRLYLP